MTQPSPNPKQAKGGAFQGSRSGFLEGLSGKPYRTIQVKPLKTGKARSFAASFNLAYKRAFKMGAAKGAWVAGNKPLAEKFDAQAKALGARKGPDPNVRVSPEVQAAAQRRYRTQEQANARRSNIQRYTEGKNQRRRNASDFDRANPGRVERVKSSYERRTGNRFRRRFR
ncbi:MAG: hypothetical protein AABX89_07425 [Candidatus Thermoplasmatota archaeon]